MQYDDSQLAAIAHATRNGDCIVNGYAGTGKCLGENTPVLMYDGTIKMVQHIKSGDLLMGPDSTPRTVTSTVVGFGSMFRVRPTKGDPFFCNADHILSVKHTKTLLRKYTNDTNVPFNISIREIVQLPKHIRNGLKAWRTSVEFDAKPVPLDPYFLGVWLGDGTSDAPSITSRDPEVVECIHDIAKQFGLNVTVKDKMRCPVYYITKGRNRKWKGVSRANPITTILREMNLIQNKHVPHIYKANSRDVRLQMLAGLLDTDGYAEPNKASCSVSFKQKVLADDVAYLARSLGMSAYVKQVRKECVNNGVWGTYYTMSISGDLSCIPMRIHRKKFAARKQIKSVLHTGIVVESAGYNSYFGFTISEPDGLFLLGDFTVTHNTTIIAAITAALDNQVELMAPTGKAAANVRDKVGIAASTIHRALLWDGDVFRRKDRITATTIVDESSMIDSAMLATLIGYARGRIILIGDAAQLPPVGPGAPFHDLIDLRPEIVHTLTKCYRASGAVHIASNAIRHGEAPEKAMSSGGEHWRMITTGDATGTIAKIEEWVKAGKYDPMQDMILAPVYGDGETDGGIDRINAAVKAILNPSDDKFAVGDRVLNNKNFSDLDFWNGDVGTITAIDVDGNYWVRLDRSPEEVCCRTEQRRELTHGWCMSVHKSQGSQARRVFFVCLKQHRHMLHRSLIYTAVTRARESCVVCGELSAFYEGINKNQRKMTALRAWQKEGAA